MKLNKSFWFFIEPYVYFVIKQNNFLFYNTLNGENVKGVFTSRNEKNLFKRFLNKNNLNSIKLNFNEIEPKTKKLILKLKSKFICDFFQVNLSQKKPVQFISTVKIINDFGKPKNKYNISDNVIDYLNELTIYLNSTPKEEVNKVYFNGHLQYLMNYISEDDAEIDFHILLNLFRNLKFSLLKRIKICGGNIFKYSKLTDLIDLLNKFNYVEKEYNILLQDFNIKLLQNHITLFEKEKNILNIIILPYDNSNFENVIVFLKSTQLKYNFVFIIDSEENLIEQEKLIKKYSLIYYKTQPYFHCNMKFFKKNVFFNKKDIFSEILDEKYVFSKKYINPLNYGSLTILPNKDVYANVNNLKIGNLVNDSIHSILYSEISNGKSWKKVRKNIKPCKECVFSEICPPISNYEYVLHRFNLCSINN